jgi:hypothetical protein
MSNYKVTVTFAVKFPNYQTKDFKFDTLGQALKFCNKIENETNWDYTVPVEINVNEKIYKKADDAFYWIEREVESALFNYA